MVVVNAPNTHTPAPTEAQSATVTPPATATSIPGVASATLTSVLPSLTPPPLATLLPTIPPQAAATALRLYTQQGAGQKADPNYRLIIASISVDSAITTLGWRTETQNGQLVTLWDDPRDAVGYLVNSALPGAPGNTVMIGHNNIFGSVFRQLSALKAGGVIQILMQGRRFNYKVEQVLIRKEVGATAGQKAETLRYFDPTPEARLTLLSCWPESTNTHRVVVIAKPEE